jgi:hypothetical protein
MVRYYQEQQRSLHPDMRINALPLRKLASASASSRTEEGAPVDRKLAGRRRPVAIITRRWRDPRWQDRALFTYVDLLVDLDAKGLDRIWCRRENG